MRAVFAFICTPLSFALLAAAMPLAAWAAPSAEATRVLGLFFYSPIVAFPIAICLGVPLYVLLRRFWTVTLGVCFASGAVCGVVGSVCSTRSTQCTTSMPTTFLITFAIHYRWGR